MQQPTMKDVAAKAGVGLGTVSRVINQQEGVSDKTKRRVEKAIQELNYQINFNAQQLKKSHSSLIGILVSGYENIFFSPIIAKLEELLEEHGVASLLHYCRDKLGEEMQQFSQRHKLSGLILLGGDLPADPEMRRLNIPCTSLFGHVQADSPYSSFHINEEQAIHKALQHLEQKLGRKKIALLHAGNSEENPVSLARIRAYHRYFQQQRRKAPNGLQFGSEFSLEAGYQAVRSFLDENKGQDLLSHSAFDALVCISDLLALGAMRALQESGYRIPQDVAIIGFDNLELGRFSYPSLSSIDQHTQGIVTMATELLLRQIRESRNGQSQEAQHISFQPKLVLRESAPEGQD